MIGTIALSTYVVYAPRVVDQRTTTVGLDLPIYRALRQRSLDDSLTEGRMVTAGELIRRALVHYLDLDYEPERRPIGRPSAEPLGHSRGARVVAEAEEIIRSGHSREEATAVPRASARARKALSVEKVAAEKERKRRERRAAQSAPKGSSKRSGPDKAQGRE